MAIENITVQIDTYDDVQYPLRILRAFRKLCDRRETRGMRRPYHTTDCILAMVNSKQQHRSDILDKAIAALEAEPGGDDGEG